MFGNNKLFLVIALGLLCVPQSMQFNADGSGFIVCDFSFFLEKIIFQKNFAFEPMDNYESSEHNYSQEDVDKDALREDLQRRYERISRNRMIRYAFGFGI